MPHFGFRPMIWTRGGEDPFPRQLALCQQAEALGFDAIFFGDRLLREVSSGQTPIYQATATDLCVTLAAVASRTTRIHLGPLVLVVPYRHPVQIAKVVASLELLSGGRLILPVGGGWNPHEFATLGVPLTEAGGRLAESVAIMRRLWQEPSVTFHGQYFHLENVGIEPRGPRPAGPPIWFGSGKPDAGAQGKQMMTAGTERVLRRVARLGEAWVPLTYSPSAHTCTDPVLLGEAWARVQAYAAEAGRPAGAVQFAYSHWYHVLQRPQDEADLQQGLQMFFPGSREEAGQTYLIGTAEQIVAKIQHLTAGVRPVSWYIFTPLNPHPRQLQLLHDQVLPHLR